ncbi:uncharacterized protein TNCV_5013931 [Trichonephila clavipes]|nr:uncharacterized protein TNCV_5013931 [Trichonephila clavipes]
MFPPLGNSTAPISSSIHSNGDYHPHNPHNIPPTSEMPWSNPNLPPRPVGNMPDSTGVPPQYHSGFPTTASENFGRMEATHIKDSIPVPPNGKQNLPGLATVFTAHRPRSFSNNVVVCDPFLIPGHHPFQKWNVFVPLSQRWKFDPSCFLC